MRQWTGWKASRLAPHVALGACAAAGLALGTTGNASAADSGALAVNPTGDASFVWRRSDGSNAIIQERERSAAGTLSDTQFLSAAGQDASLPRVALAPDGTAIFVWSRFNGTNFIIQARSRAPNDGALSGVQNLSAAGQNATSAPQVAVDSSGRATFVWARFNGTNQIVQTRRRLANGTLEATQSISGSGQNAREPGLGVDPDGNATFVWRRFDSANDIIQSRRRLANGTFQGVQNLSAAGQNAQRPQVAVDPNGNATFTWDRAGQIQARRRLANGTLEATQDLSGGLNDSSQVAVDPNGNANFAWTHFNGFNTIIQARRRLPNGTLEAIQNLSAAGQDAHIEQLAVAPNGAATFAWVRSDGTNNLAQTRRRFTGGTFSAVQNLSAAGADAFDVNVGVDASDNATFVWERLGVIQTRRRAGSLGATVDLSN